MMFWLEILAFESPSLDLDITLFIQTGIFVLLMLALRQYILKPYFAAYDAREALTNGAKEEAQVLQKKAAEAQTEYETQRQKAYAEVESARKSEVAEASDEASKTLEKARVKVQADIAEKQKNLELELASARRSMAPEVEAISAQITKKILV